MEAPRPRKDEAIKAENNKKTVLFFTAGITITEQRNMKKHWIRRISEALLLIALAPPVVVEERAAGFYNIGTDSRIQIEPIASDDVQDALERGIMNGYDDGTI